MIHHAFEHIEDQWYRARLPDGSWGLFEWRREVQTMEHVDTLEDPPHFGKGTCSACKTAGDRTGLE